MTRQAEPGRKERTRRKESEKRKKERRKTTVRLRLMHLVVEHPSSVLTHGGSKVASLQVRGRRRRLWLWLDLEFLGLASVAPGAGCQLLRLRPLTTGAALEGRAGDAVPVAFGVALCFITAAAAAAGSGSAACAGSLAGCWRSTTAGSG